MIDMKEFETLPCTVNKETLTKACHISKRTALYFLQSGLIPGRATGKKTRCYLIEKEDILRFISDREKNPSKYRVLQNWCRSRIPCGILRQPVPENRTAKRYYTSVLSSYPELLTRSDVACLTGYSPNTVSLWISKGELKKVGKHRQSPIPKTYLIEFLCSDFYAGIARKSSRHKKEIQEISEEIGKESSEC